MTRLARDLHPVAWWLWAMGLSLAASMTTNPILLLLLVGAAALVVVARRSDQPWAGSFRLYLWLGLMIVVIRVLFRVVLGGGAGLGGNVLFTLPEIPLPDFVLGVHLFGPVTSESLLAGLYDGMRLAAIVICVGAANSLANPKRLLKSVPPALYEIGTALVVAITVLPQLADSLRRVRAAQALRGGPAGRVASLRRLLVPILEDAFERSLKLAAGMDARGYGRAGTLTARQRLRTGVLMLAGLCGICIGSYAVLDLTAPRALALPMLLVGCVLAGVGLLSAGRQVQRTRYRPEVWRWPEFAVIAAGFMTGAIVLEIARTDILVVHPGVTSFPTISVGCLVAVLIAMTPAVLAPPPVLAFRRAVAVTPAPERALAGVSQ